MAEIPLYRNSKEIARTIVDDADEAWVNQWKWHLRRLPASNNNGYATRFPGPLGGPMETVYLHRALLGLPNWVKGGLEVDHINLDSLDNRRSNLRIVPHKGNQQNCRARRGSVSKHRGVCWDAVRSRWTAKARLDGKTYNLGRFDDEEEAARVVSAWRRLHMPYSADAMAA